MLPQFDPPGAKYKPGNIFLIRYEWADWNQHSIVFILEHWKVKSIYYRILVLKETLRSGWHQPRVEEVTERRLEEYWSGVNAEILDKDLTFLAKYGSHVSMIEEAFKNGFIDKVSRQIELAQKRLTTLIERKEALQKADRLLEARYEEFDTGSE